MILSCLQPFINWNDQSISWDDSQVVRTKMYLAACTHRGEKASGEIWSKRSWAGYSSDIMVHLKVKGAQDNSTFLYSWKIFWIWQTTAPSTCLLAHVHMFVCHPGNCSLEKSQTDMMCFRREKKKPKPKKPQLKPKPCGINKKLNVDHNTRYSNNEFLVHTCQRTPPMPLFIL